MVQKEVIEGWTDADYADMEVSKAIAQIELSFTTTILPLVDIHTESSGGNLRQRKDWKQVRARVCKIWWET